MLRVERAGLADMAGVYRVCLLTDDAGEDASALHKDPDLPGHVYTGPYLAIGGGTQLVVVDEAGVAGYLLSTDDTAAFEAWAEAEWWPPLRERYPRTDPAAPSWRVIRHIHERTSESDDLLKAYPAHFHIDLVTRARGSGIGRTLIERLLTELRGRDVPGVHMGVDARNTNAIGFYEHLGFGILVRESWGVTMGMRLP